MWLFLLAFSFSQTPETNCNHEDKLFRCVEVLSNYDGDTLTVNIPGVHPFFGKKTKVRVLGIDTAEMKGKAPCEKEASKKAQKLLESLLKNAKQVDLKNIDKDKYHRILADVIVDGKSISEELIASGLAVRYKGDKKRSTNWCEVLKNKKSQ